jgi:hydrogenase large subunit
MARIVVDPITRIEGHLRIEADINASNTITAAYSSGTQVRGMEKILVGRDPREAWAFAQRTCGVCTTVNAIASVRAVENALGITIPKVANIMRNMMLAQQYVHDHVMHFYHLHALDWVDIVSALKADPAETATLQKSLSAWPNNTTEYFAGVQAKVKAIVDSGQLGIFGNAYWGHPAYKLPPAVNLLAVAHYLEALDWQRDVVQIHVVFGGKNPHPSFLVGGAPISINMNGASVPPKDDDEDDSGVFSGRQPGLTPEGLAVIEASIVKIRQFVKEVYLPDLLAIASYYPEYLNQGAGPNNFLTWGEFPGDNPNNPASMLVPPGVITAGNLAAVTKPSAADKTRMLEYVTRSWYSYKAGNTKGLHPWDGETTFNYTGPKPPYTQLTVTGKYSWLKSPRWNGSAMEVGPLARVLMMYAGGNAEVKALVDQVLAKLGVPIAKLNSTLGRTAARGIETQVFADALARYYNDLVTAIKAGDVSTFNRSKWSPATWPASAQGFGLTEAPRGALGHWIVIASGKIKNYQQVVPTTWNASPRDAAGKPGPYEVALVGTKLADPTKPLEILRTVHSFDPCMSCAVHLIDARGERIGEATTGLNVCLR